MLPRFPGVTAFEFSMKLLELSELDRVSFGQVADAV
jgi:hypothetical protein